jgi:hypothetical protein
MFISFQQLGGIIEPNDGKCHLDKDGIYTHSTLQDYPSVLQLNNKVRENAINIIFAVTEPQREAYSVLTKIIDGTKVGLLTADSSNVLELVEEQYKVYSGSGFAHYDFFWTLSPIQALLSSNFRGFLNGISWGSVIHNATQKEHPQFWLNSKQSQFFSRNGYTNDSAL